MLKNISKNLSAKFTRPVESTKSPAADSVPLATWPDDATIFGEPLFNRPLTSVDFDALQESAGLGPISWWLDSELARSDSIDALTYEDEIAITAMLRAPFEQAGPVRSAAGGLLDRLNELERIQALAMEEEKRRAQGKEKKVRHHSTLRLAPEDNPEDEEVENDLDRMGKMGPPSGGNLRRRDTYAVNRREPLAVKQPQEGINPRYCKSPERRDYRPSESGDLQRTYSKGSLNHLQFPGELQRSLNGLAASDLSGNSTQLLGRTFDAEQLSDVFPSPRASTENFDPSGQAPPPKPSTDLPQGANRHMTFVRQPARSRNLQRDDTIVPRASASPMRNGRPSREPPNETPLRDSLPSRLDGSQTTAHKLSAPEMVSSLKTNGSGSNLIPTNMSDAMALMKEQEMKLRASSGRTGELNISLASSMERNGSANGSTNRLNKSLPIDGVSGSGLSHIFAQREVKDVPQRYDPDGKRNTTGELSRNKSSSQSSLKDMASLNEMIRAQQESLRASGEQIMQKVRSRSSMSQSVGSSISSRDGSPHVPPVSQKEPALHQSLERPGGLHVSGATYDLKPEGISLNSSIASEDLSLPKRTSSPVTMRRPPRGSGANVPPPLTLPIDVEVTTPSTPHTARPGSYVEQLHSAKHASSAVEAWVADTMTAMNNDTIGIVNLSASGESFSGMRGSTETYALQEEEANKNIRPTDLRAPPPKLVEPPQSLLTESIMTTSQRTVTAKTPTSPSGKSGIRRAIAPSAIRGGRPGTVPTSSASGRPTGVSSIRLPAIPRIRPPAVTSSTTATTVSKLQAPRVAPNPSNLRPPVPRLRPPTSIPRSRLPVPREISRTSASRSTSRTNSRAPE
nr:expressed protein [Hymenolepis microstoma]